MRNAKHPSGRRRGSSILLFLYVVAAILAHHAPVRVVDKAVRHAGARAAVDGHHVLLVLVPLHAIVAHRIHGLYWKEAFIFHADPSAAVVPDADSQTFKDWIEQ